MKHYLNDLLCAAAPEDGPTQEALEWAIVVDHFPLTWNLGADTAALVKHKAALVDRYRATQQQQEADLRFQAIILGLPDLAHAA